MTFQAQLAATKEVLEEQHVDIKAKLMAAEGSLAAVTAEANHTLAQVERLRADLATANESLAKEEAKAVAVADERVALAAKAAAHDALAPLFESAQSQLAATSASLSAEQAAQRGEVARLNQWLTEAKELAASLTVENANLTGWERKYETLAQQFAAAEASLKAQQRRREASVRAVAALQNLMGRPDASAIFATFDADGDGTVSRGEMREGMRLIGEELSEMVSTQAICR